MDGGGGDEGGGGGGGGDEGGAGGDGSLHTPHSEHTGSAPSSLQYSKFSPVYVPFSSVYV